MTTLTKQEQQGLQEVNSTSPSSARGIRLLSKHSVRYSTDGSVIKLSREEAGIQCAAAYSLTPTALETLSNPNCLDSIIQTGCSLERREREGKDPIPTIAVLRDAFGDEMVMTWMFRNIELFIELLGINKTNVPEIQKRFIAQMLIGKFTQGSDRLNVSEVLLFFYKAAQGDCGKFYGTVDTQTFGGMAEKFLDWRYNTQTLLEQSQIIEENKRRYDEMMECPPPTQEQLDELHRVMAMFDNRKKIQRDENGYAIYTEETEAEKRRRDEHQYEFMCKFLTPEQIEKFKAGKLDPTKYNQQNE